MSILLNTSRKSYGDKGKSRIERTEIISCRFAKRKFGFELKSNRLKVPGTLFNLLTIGRILAMSRWQHLFHFKKKKKKSSVRFKENSYPEQLMRTHTHTLFFLRLMFSTPSNYSTYIESKHCLSSVKQSGPFSQSGRTCLLYSTEIQTKYHGLVKENCRFLKKRSVKMHHHVHHQ